MPDLPAPMLACRPLKHRISRRYGQLRGINAPTPRVCSSSSDGPTNRIQMPGCVTRAKAIASVQRDRSADRTLVAPVVDRIKQMVPTGLAFRPGFLPFWSDASV
jgi:hypothetical protein